MENRLEFDGDEEVDTDIVECYEIVHGDEEYLVAGAVIARREEKNILLTGLQWMSRIAD